MMTASTTTVGSTWSWWRRRRRTGGFGLSRYPAKQGADAKPQLTARQRRSELRDRNASLARDLARRANMTHAQVNRELNRLSGVTRISEATEAQLQRRLDEANRWSRRVR